jgi:hypothetical protein
MIKRFNSFNEALHINKDVDQLAEELFPKIKEKGEGVISFINNGKTNLDFQELVVNIRKNMLNPNVSGSLDVSKSRKLSNGKWFIKISLTPSADISTFKHELNHAFRLTKIGKVASIKNLNYLKTLPFHKDEDIRDFFYIIYMANDEEINSTVIETFEEVKNKLKKFTNFGSKNTNDDFKWIIQSTPGFIDAEMMKEFSCEKHFRKFTKNQINKFFWIIEQNKKELDAATSGPFRKFKFMGHMIKKFFNKEDLEDDGKTYIPKRGIKFYDNWINKQGKKLERKLYSLYGHFY